MEFNPDLFGSSKLPLVRTEPTAATNSATVTQSVNPSLVQYTLALTELLLRERLRNNGDLPSSLASVDGVLPLPIDILTRATADTQSAVQPNESGIDPGSNSVTVPPLSAASSTSESPAPPIMSSYPLFSPRPIGPDTDIFGNLIHSNVEGPSSQAMCPLEFPLLSPFGHLSSPFSPNLQPAAPQTNTSNLLQRELLPLLSDLPEIDCETSKKVKLSSANRRYLIEIFDQDDKPPTEVLQKAARKVGKSLRHVQYFFQNRRAALRRKRNSVLRESEED
ncbi:hypothetical protein BC830DRAFT_39454 [Chytriomyces sp. MP71]|nr:hypothetical protein BC830DRAFT_39454 [Chytriomyces sp. MP71]